LEGIRKLPRKARFGVYVAYIYYRTLLKKIKNTEPEFVLQQRIRIPNHQKAALFARSYLRHSFNLL
jgi:phytoene/squalene synthetase